MNVLHFINNLNREGAQVMVKNLVTSMNKTEADYTVCLRQPGGSLVAELRDQGIKVYQPSRYFGFASSLHMVRFLRQVCVDNKIQIVHAHMADAAFLGWLVARKLKLPLIISHHGFDILVKCNHVCRAIYFILLNLSARYAAINVAVSSSVAQRVRQLLWLPENRVQVISNGVSVPNEHELGNSLSEKNRLNPAPVMVNLGRLVPLKGQRQLIIAMDQLVDYFPNIKLQIVGQGDLTAELKGLAEDCKVDSHVEFIGAVDDVSPYLAQADLYVSSSRSEGMPVSVLEAMAWQLPVVASAIPGNKSVVKPDETGFLYELDDIDDLVRCIVMVVNDSVRANSAASRARKMVEKNYSASVAERNHERLYKRILKPA